MTTTSQIEMIPLPGGTFTMGSPKGEFQRGKEGPQHQVMVPAFLMGKYPIMQGEYESVMGKNPSKFKGIYKPVDSVSWYDAVEFCNKLSQQTGREYRLPSEAEWEYACRAGTTTPFYFGQTITTEQVNYDGDRFEGETKNTGSFPPNPFGLYDMHGNVWEWCQDVWHDSYEGAPTDGSAWITGDSDARLLRGGAWDKFEWHCRSASRYCFHPGWKGNNIGFRISSRV